MNLKIETRRKFLKIKSSLINLRIIWKWFNQTVLVAVFIISMNKNLRFFIFFYIINASQNSYIRYIRSLYRLFIDKSYFIVPCCSMFNFSFKIWMLFFPNNALFCVSEFSWFQIWWFIDLLIFIWKNVFFMICYWF